jgi:hypothetical protein
VETSVKAFFALSLLADFPKIARARAGKILIASSDCGWVLPVKGVVILTTSNNSVVHFRVRQILLHQLQYDDTDLRSECRELFNRVPDTLDLRLIRSVVGEYFREFERPFHNRPTDWQEEAKRRWDQFVRTTANELLIEYQTADRLFRRLTECQLELLDLGFRPNYRDLLCQLSEVNPGRALQLAECLIQNPSHALALDFDTLVLHPTKADLARRLGFCQRAIETQGDEIRAGAIGCFTWWRRDGELPHESWELILECAHGAGHLAAHALVRFVWLNDATFLARDWEILAAIPLNPADFVVHELIGRAAHLIEHGHIPSAEVATKILSVLEWVPSLGDHDIEHGLKEFGKHFPGKVFTVIWRRHQLRKKGDANLEVVPFDFEQLHFSDIRADPDAADVITELENRLLNESHLDYRENQILQMAIMQSGDSPEPHLLRLIERASTGDQLERITDFARTRHSWPIVLECPDFTKAILVKARSQDGDCYSKIFAHLQSFRGGRGFTGGGPTGDWKALIECSVSMAEKYATDPELGEFYLGAAKYERDGLAEMQRHSRAADENLDDF